MKTVWGMHRSNTGSKSSHHPLPLQATVWTAGHTWLVLFLRSKITWNGQRTRGYVLVDLPLWNLLSSWISLNVFTQMEVLRLFCALTKRLSLCSSGAQLQQCHLLHLISLRWLLFSRDFCLWVSACISWPMCQPSNYMSLSTWHGACGTVLPTNTFVLSH